MRSLSWTRASWTVALGFAAATFGANAASAKPVRPIRSRALNLFSLPVHVMNVNRVVCPIVNNGQVCVDSTQSPVAEGSFWPKGTADNYVFNSGLQAAGIIKAAPNFPWNGDTVGVFFMDPRGDQLQGDGVTQVWSSLDANDVASWPSNALVHDAAIFHPVLLGRKSVSQEDLWVRAWDGSPARLAGRTHPMGILVEERGLAWNYPTGNEDIDYFIYTFYNISASNCAKYQNATIDPSIADSLCDIGKNFQALNSQHFGITFPDTGYAFVNLFAAFFEDCDVGNASFNYSTPIPLFNLGFCWKSDFLEPSWSFPADVYRPPFAIAPGLTGTKYLASPNDSTGKPLGLTLFSNTINAANNFPDAVGVKQLFRYLHGTTTPAAGDFPCTFQGQQLQRHYCFLAQTAQDTRFFMSSGPFTLPAGEARTMVLAYLYAPVSGAIVPYIGGDLAQGIPPTDTGLARAVNPDTIRTIDRGAGWVSHSDVNGDGKIEQNEVTTLPGSLLKKALVSQAVFDNKFLLPFAPEPPNFFLIPGDNQVTISWERSNTETVGDPFYVIASKPTVIPAGGGPAVRNPLYDPNFRQFDVEGYRIYRGRTSGALQLVAQFDYAGTVMSDYLGDFLYPGNCAPELGVQTDCPVTFDTGTALVVPTSPHVDHPLIGSIIQVPVAPSGRVLTASGAILLFKSDTAITGGGSGRPPLQDTGVPFVFVDKSVRNSFNYFYAVTAFDVKSLPSAPSSLESPFITKQVTPRKASGQETAGSITPPVLLSPRGDTLNPNAALPTIDANTGILSGPEPPTNGFGASMAVFVPQLLSTGTVSVTIDSIQAGNPDPLGLGTAAPALYYVTSQGPTGAAHAVLPLNLDGFNADSATTRYLPVTLVDKTKVGRFGGDSTFSIYASVGVTASGTWTTESYGRASANSAPANSPENGPRWWAGATNENTANPNSAVCHPAGGACTDTVFNNRTNVKTAGALPGVQYILHPLAYSTLRSSPMRTLEPVLATVTRAADFKVYWKGGGGLDSVVDVTHKAPVPFSARMGTGWGFLNDSSFVGVTSAPDGNNALLTWSDIFCVAPAPAFTTQCGGGATTPAVLMNHARLTPIADTAVAFAGTATATASGNGFIFYIGGHFFLMQMAALPSAGTIWTLRTYAGNVTGKAGSYAIQHASFRPPNIPGLRAQFQFVGSTFSATSTNDSVLAHAHTVPDPYYVTNALEFTANTKVLKFVNLPAQCIIRIYSTSGILVQVLTHNDATGGGEATWNLRNRNNQFVASGVYFYHIEAADGKTKVGRFTVITFAP